MSTILNCPNCKQTVSIPKHLSGHIIRCPSCNGRITPPEDGKSPNNWRLSPQLELRLMACGGFLTFAWTIVTVLCWFGGVSLVGSWASTGLFVFAGISAVVIFLVSIGVFLVSLRVLFAKPQWTAVASLTAAVLSFIANSVFILVALAAISMSVLGIRAMLEAFRSPPQQAAPRWP